MRHETPGKLREKRSLCNRNLAGVEGRRTAQAIAAPENNAVVAFGSRVTFERDDGRVQTYRIVGEDEANPKAGSLSFVSPVASRLIGKSVGDVVTVGEQELEITAIG